MSILTQSSVDNIMSKFGGNASTQVVNAIYDASNDSGIDFSYLLNQAKAESSFDADAEAKTSSAAGLYQFINSTWLNMVDQHGEKYGVDVQNSSREELLELRKNPELASNMAAEFALENKKYLDRNWGGEVGSTELYFAHFMGASGAAGFLKELDYNPHQTASVLFPKAAKANQNVFYDPANGEPRTLAQVYDFFDTKFQNEVESPIKVAEQSSVYKKAVHTEEVSPVFDLQSRIGSHNSMPIWNLVTSPVELMILAQMDLPFGKSKNL